MVCLFLLSFSAFCVWGPLCEPTGMDPISSLQTSMKKVVLNLHSFYYRGWWSDCLGLNSVVTTFSFGLCCHWVVLTLCLTQSHSVLLPLLFNEELERAIVSPSNSACGSWQNYRRCFFMKTFCSVLLTLQLCPLLSQFIRNFFFPGEEKNRLCNENNREI